jgi:hypothetical protein
MAYNPGISYRGADYLFSGLQQGGSALAQGIQTWQKSKEESQFLDQQAAELAKLIAPRAQQMEQTGSMTPEDKAILDDLAKFPSLSLGAKRGKLSGIMFGVQQRAQQSQADAEGQRHQDRMGIERANVELRRGALMAGEAKDQRQAAAKAASDRDTLGWLTALANPESIPSPVDPSRRMEFLRGEFPNPDARIISELIGTETPMALRKQAVAEGNLRVAEQHVQNRQAELNQPTGRPMTPSQRAGIIARLAKMDEQLAYAEDDQERAAIEQRMAQMEAILEGTTGSAPAITSETQAPAASQPKALTPEQAREFLKSANGDKAKARELARSQGYTF